MSNLLTSYTWTDSSNIKWPICSSKFIYGILGPTDNVLSSSVYYTASNSAWGSLNVISLSQGNSNLVGFTQFKLNNVTYQTISANQSGIYRIRLTLSFTGVGFNSGSGIYYRLSDVSNNNLSIPISSTSNPSISSLTSNQLLSLGNIFSPGASIQITISNYLPFITITPAYSSSTSFQNDGLSVIEQTVYLQANNPVFFNIATADDSAGYLNATGNFTLELLSYVKT
jgi:hypothetical protein